MRIRVYIESGPKKVFASALDWPGWSRSGKTEAEALATLEAYAPRYRPVAAAAGFELPESIELEVVERVPGSANTDFGVPHAQSATDVDPVEGPGLKRLEALRSAARATFERVAAAAPAELRKGPRGGGRDTAKIVAHVQDAEAIYVKRPWPVPYADRRSAWHSLDHAWEIEDRTEQVREE